MLWGCEPPVKDCCLCEEGAHARDGAGGGDDCEDVFSGLQKVGQLSWKTAPGAAKALYHVADAPCHGSRFHSWGAMSSTYGIKCDDFLGGDKLGRSLGDLLSKLRVEIGIRPYTFAHITDCCRKMVEEFRKETSDPQWIMETEMGTDTSRLTEQVTFVESRKQSAKTIHQ